MFDFDDGFFSGNAVDSSIDIDQWQPSTFGDDGVIGSNGDYVQQTTDFTCAVVSQEMILHDFGVDVSEAQLVYDAAKNGWLTDYGTSPDDVGKLLELHGVPTHTNYNGNVESLASELAHGHKIIVGVDSNELWNGVSLSDRVGEWLGWDKGADHAIVINGLDFSNPNDPQVIINDPGNPIDGAGKNYPLDQFLHAWGDSGFTYTATDNAPDSLAARGTGFNAETGVYGTQADWNDYLPRLAIDAAAITGDIWFTGGQTIASDAFADAIAVLTDADRNGLFMQI
jgi:hypothetical protein